MVQSIDMTKYQYSLYVMGFKNEGCSFLTQSFASLHDHSSPISCLRWVERFEGRNEGRW